MTAPSAGAQITTTPVSVVTPAGTTSTGGLIFTSSGNAYLVQGNTAPNCQALLEYIPSSSATAGKYVSSGYVPFAGCFLNPVVEGPDQQLYGATGQTLYKLNPDFSVNPTPTILHNFNEAVDGAGGSLILGSDGTFYGSFRLGDGYNGLYKIGVDGSNSTLLWDFTGGPQKNDSNGTKPSALVEGDDGNFYGSTLDDDGMATYGCTACQSGTIFKMTPAGELTTIATIPNGSLPLDPGTLVEGPDGAFYGTGIGFTSNYRIYGAPSVFRVTKSGVVTVLHDFTPDEGAYITAPLVLGGDGVFYGTSNWGGDPTICVNQQGCGTLFSITPSGVFTKLFNYPAGAGAYPSSPALAPDGSLYTLTTAGLYRTTFPAGQQIPPIQLQLLKKDDLTPLDLSKPLVGGTPVVLKWNVLNAFSNTMRQCFASFSQGGAFAAHIPGDGTGLLSGSVTAGGFGGQATLTLPAASGPYTYALTCGGVESNSGQFTVSGAVKITTLTLPNPVVSKPYQLILQAIGGTPPYTWGFVSTPPPGITIDGYNGIITGTPTQYGVYQLGIGVQDSSKVPATATTVLPMTIDSGLALVNVLPNAVMGSAYLATATATGGLGSYTWSLASGNIPAGLIFNTTTGVLFGTPTTVGKSTFTIAVHDGENPVAMVTQAYSVSTFAQPLMVQSVTLPTCTVNVLCQGQLAATGGVPPYTWSVQQNTSLPANAILPPGLTLSSDGSFSGKPTQYSLYSFSGVYAQVTDSDTPAVTATGYSPLPVVSGLKIVSIPLPVATVGVAYRAPAPVATGGLPPYTWTISALSATIQVLQNEYGVSPKDGILYSSPTPQTPGMFTLIYNVSDSEQTPDNVSVNAAFTVVSPPLPSTTTISSSTAVAGTGMYVTLSATVRKTGAIPSGTVVFYAGTAPLGTVPLDAGGNATLPASFAASGSYNLTAAYSGDASTAPSVSSAIIETVVMPSITGAISPSALMIKSGSSGTLLITVTPVGGYTGTISFSCGSLPAHVSCTFAPPSLNLASGSGPITDTLTINTAAVTSARLPGSESKWNPVLALTLWLPGGLWFLRRSWGRRFQRNLRSCLLGVLLVGVTAATLAIGGCAGSTSNSAQPGTYTVPLTLATSGGETQLTATVTIQ